MVMRNWIGKLLAESQTAKSVTLLTLTYGGGDHVDSAILNYRHVRLMFMRLRKAGYKFTYFNAGEYGGLKGRTHWHVLIFWQSNEPPFSFSMQKWTWDYWPHGFTYAERPKSTAGSVHYVAKYLLKDEGAEIRYSTGQALGTKYLIEYARKHVREGHPLFHAGAFYTIAGNYRRQKTGEQRQLFRYYLKKDASLYRTAVKAYVTEWAKTRDDLPALRYEEIDFCHEWLGNAENLPAYLERFYDRLMDRQNTQTHCKWRENDANNERRRGERQLRELVHGQKEKRRRAKADAEKNTTERPNGEPIPGTGRDDRTIGLSPEGLSRVNGSTAEDRNMEGGANARIDPASQKREAATALPATPGKGCNDTRGTVSASPKRFDGTARGQNAHTLQKAPDGQPSERARRLE